MPPALRSPLTVEERAAKHRLIARDSVALSSLLTLVLTLTFVTYLLFHSFAGHRTQLEQRWKRRGEAALANHQPLVAIDSLRSALAYAPDDRTLQIELATALAAAGRTQEAVVYFDTLHEAEPGDGMINLQLARLAITQGNAPLAVTQYEAALDGTWNGDGTLRRRQVRLELSRYLIAQHRFDEARNQLLIAAGNAADNHALQLTVAGLLEHADGEADAYTLYRKAVTFSDTRTAGLIGAGRTAAAQSRYLLARNLLQQASAQPDFGRLPEDERAAVRSLLAEAVAILDMFPAENLPLHVRAVRVAHAVQVVQSQLDACAAPAARGTVPAASNPSALRPATVSISDKGSLAPSGAAPAGPPTNAANLTAERSTNGAPPVRAIRSAISSAVQRAGDTLAGVASATSLPVETEAQSAARMQASADRWRQLLPYATLERRMERDPALLENTLQMVYDFEKSEAQLTRTIGCAPPGRYAKLLQRIALAPDEIDQQ